MRFVKALTLIAFVGALHVAYAKTPDTGAGVGQSVSAPTAGTQMVTLPCGAVVPASWVTPTKTATKNNYLAEIDGGSVTTDSSHTHR